LAKGSLHGGVDLAGFLSLNADAVVQGVKHALRECLRRGRPFGDAVWRGETTRRLGLEASLRPRGRPRKAAADGPSLVGEEGGAGAE
jgi:hypothetical protein